MVSLSLLFEKKYKIRIEKNNNKNLHESSFKSILAEVLVNQI